MALDVTGNYRSPSLIYTRDWNYAAGVLKRSPFEAGHLRASHLRPRNSWQNSRPLPIVIDRQHLAADRLAGIGGQKHAGAAMSFGSIIALIDCSAIAAALRGHRNATARHDIRERSDWGGQCRSSFVMRAALLLLLERGAAARVNLRVSYASFRNDEHKS